MSAIKSPPVMLINGASGPSPSKSLVCKVTVVPPPTGIKVAVNVVITSSSLTGTGIVSSSSEQDVIVQLQIPQVKIRFSDTHHLDNP